MIDGLGEKFDEPSIHMHGKLIVGGRTASGTITVQEAMIKQEYLDAMYESENELFERKSILHEGLQGNYFVVFDLPTTADQSRDRRVAVLDLRSTSEEIEAENKSIRQIAENCKKVFKVEEKSLLA